MGREVWGEVEVEEEEGTMLQHPPQGREGAELRCRGKRVGVVCIVALDQSECDIEGAD